MTKPKSPATPKPKKSPPPIDRGARTALSAIGTFIKSQSWPVETDEVIAAIDKLGQ
ncbi:hypothetical protein LCGC14_2651630 [marine sediment metagenome]|uniref:Uncharacterized protein n=1 Tax=marine sediment metagenome TaxID=412755 RepID=A0A0F9AGY5_9ZZZZ